MIMAGYLAHWTDISPKTSSYIQPSKGEGALNRVMKLGTKERRGEREKSRGRFCSVA
jgi:hypothetical protein